ncbi:LytR/AlgR family response regulator transcription factor [Tenacibaculum retecalamus]|uniref:LytR/AlgR family response regulator transcription factor n=1 Tax=Tenacibaculum retecalamus TaxID=3018315 RepID=UPI0023D8FCD0|nr:LytTR family DNA-binding domain-containing protein [Tenacibaculum retecalamus]WBX70103.1 LytTR family DNA-binding domain-containing protein [Tenacibaculum retecalamus]
MTYVIIDDEPAAIEVLQFHLKNIPFVTLRATFRDPLKGLEYLQEHEIDVIFLDINMPQLSGINLPKYLKTPPLIIFTTAYTEYAIESYQLNAIDYLLKPIGFDRLLQSIMKAKEVLDKKITAVTTSLPLIPKANGQTVFIKSGQEYHQVAIQGIKYIESDGNYVTFVTITRSILARYKISEVIEMLPQEYFIRTHRSYIVALKYIETVKKHCVVINDREIPLSSNYRENLLGVIDELGKDKS